MIARDGGGALTRLKEVFDAGHDLKLFCANLLEYLRDCMVLLAADDREALFDVAASEIGERKEAAAGLGFARAHQAYSILQAAEVELRTSDHPRMTLEVALLRMCQIEPIADLGALVERLEGMGGGEPPPRAQAPAPVPATPAPQAVAAPPPPQAPPGGSEEAGLREVENAPAPGGEDTPRAEGSAPAQAAEWDAAAARKAWRGAVDALPPARRALFQGAELDLGDAGRILVALAPANAGAHGLACGAVPEIEAYLAAHAPFRARVEIAAADNGAPAASPAPEHRAEDEAVIQEVVDLFDGRIVDIRPHRVRKSGGTSGA